MNDRNLNILLVEDNKDHADLLSYCLAGEERSSQVHHVSDGEKALKYLFSQQPNPDLILLDLNIPKVSGLELLEKIKTDFNLKVIPTVILTTSNSFDDKRSAYESGANSYLVKPINFADFQKQAEKIEEYWGEYNKTINN